MYHITNIVSRNNPAKLTCEIKLCHDYTGGHWSNLIRTVPEKRGGYIGRGDCDENQHEN